MSEAEKMREAAARVADDHAEPGRFKVSDTWKNNMTPSEVYETAAIDVSVWIAHAIRALPIPAPQPDPRRSVDEINAKVVEYEAKMEDDTLNEHTDFYDGYLTALEWALSATSESAK